MPRVSVLLSVVAVVLLGLVTVGRAVTASAQEATPAAEEGALPEGVTFEPLAQAVVEELPPAPADVFFARFTLAPGAGFPLDPDDPSLVLVYVESGAFTFQLTTEVRVARVVVAGTPVAQEVAVAGVAFELGAGDSVVLPPFVAGEVGNAGQEPAVALVAGVEPLAPVATPAAATPVAATPAPEGTPAAEEEEFELPEGVTFQPLAFGSVDELPAGPAALVIGRLTVDPGAAIPSHERPGPEFGVVEAGTASVTVAEGEVQVVRELATLATPFAEPTVEAVGAGEEVTLEPEDAVFFQPGAVADLRNEGEEPLEILLGRIEPLGAEGTPVAGTPAP